MIMLVFQDLRFHACQEIDKIASGEQAVFTEGVDAEEVGRI